MGTSRASNVLIRSISLAFIVLFVYTTTGKLMHLDEFRSRLERMPFLETFASWLAVGVPFLELVITGLLLFPKYQLAAFRSSLGLMALFTVYVATVLTTNESIPCSCGGVISAMGWKEHMLFNTAFMLLAILGIYLIKKQQTHFLKQNTT